MRRLIVCGVVGILLAGCGQVPGSVTALPTVTPGMEARMTQGANAIETVDNNPTATPTQQRAAQISTTAPILPTVSSAELPAELSQTGPWLVFLTSESDSAPDMLWVINSDGGGMTRISPDQVNSFAVRPVRNTRGQAEVAYITSTDFGWRGFELKIVTLPDLQVVFDMPLTSAENTYPATATGDTHDMLRLSDIAEVLRRPDSLTWSPDGRWLAFLAAANGLSTDVYSFDADTSDVRHLTGGAGHAFELNWSPDSRYILHAAADTLQRSGGLYENLEGVWVAAPDESEVRQVEERGTAALFGPWISGDSLLIGSGPAMGCYYHLRIVNIVTGQRRMIRQCYSSWAYDPEDDVALVTSDNDLHVPGDSAGTFLIHQDRIIRISEDFRSKVWWEPTNHVFIIGEGGSARAIKPNGTDAVLPRLVPTVSSGSYSAWHPGPWDASAGLWFGSDVQNLFQVTDESVDTLGWSPDGRFLAYVTHDGATLAVVDTVGWKQTIHSMDISDSVLPAWTP